MTNSILVATHAHMASGLLSSLKLLTGLGANIDHIDAYVNGNDDYNQALTDFINQTDGKPAVVFTDLLGGSVNQKVLLATNEHPNITVVTQTNLAILMSAALSTEPLTRTNLQKMVNECQVTIATVNDTDADNQEDEDF
jgi:PTS system mannose-specific IIA component